MGNPYIVEDNIRSVEKLKKPGTFYRVNNVEKENGELGTDLRVVFEKKDGTIQYTTSGLFINKEDLPTVIKWLLEADATQNG